MQKASQECHSEALTPKNPEMLRCAQKDRISLSEAAAFLLQNDNYLILTHRRPDGDTIGSAAALCRGLRAIGKTAWICENPQFTPKFAPFLETLIASVDACRDKPRLSASAGLGEADERGSSLRLAPTILSVDVASRSLFPFGMEQAEVALAIDHHGSNDGFAARTHVEADKAACGEIIWALLGLLDVQPDKQIAEAIYVAVSTDTGCFRYANVTANTLRVAADCLACGAESYPITRVMFETKRWPRLQLERYLVEHMAFFHGGLVAVSAIPNAVLDELGLTEDDIDDISGFGLLVEGVEIAVMLREVEGGDGKISVRTGPGYDASAICRRLGGGGHKGAAGATVAGGIQQAKAEILTAIEEEMKE